MNRPEEFLNISSVDGFKNPLLFAFTGLIQVLHVFTGNYLYRINEHLLCDYNTEYTKVFYDKAFIDELNYASEQISNEKECVKMCLIDEKCDAFEYKTELGAIVSTCLLIELKNSITMEYSFDVRHTGSVVKMVRIIDNLKTVF